METGGVGTMNDIYPEKVTLIRVHLRPSAVKK